MGLLQCSRRSRRFRPGTRVGTRGVRVSVRVRGRPRRRLRRARVATISRKFDGKLRRSRGKLKLWTRQLRADIRARYSPEPAAAGCGAGYGVQEADAAAETRFVCRVRSSFVSRAASGGARVYVVGGCGTDAGGETGERWEERGRE